MFPKHGQNDKQVLLICYIYKSVFLANSEFVQASTRLAFNKCIYWTEPWWWVEGKIPETLKGCHLFSVHVCLSVCLCVRMRSTGHTFWPRHLFFGLSDQHWVGMRKKHMVFVFSKFLSYACYWHFSIFSLYNTRKC